MEVVKILQDEGIVVRDSRKEVRFDSFISVIIRVHFLNLFPFYRLRIKVVKILQEEGIVVRDSRKEVGFC
jgi:hypothetical protein